MNTNVKLLSTLGMCKKAGKLVIGFDAVATAIQRGEASLLVLAADISPKSAKRIIRLATDHGVSHLQLDVSMIDIERLVGKKAGILAVTDQGLAKSIAAKSKARQVEEESV